MYQPSILRICRTYSSVMMDHHDLFQEVLANLWKGYDSFRGDSSRGTWVYRVTLYTCLQFHRKHKRAVKLEPSDLPADEENEQLEQMMGIIRKLKEPDRAILLLYLEERSYQEIAGITGLTESNVGARLSRVKKKIKNKMLQNE